MEISFSVLYPHKIYLPSFQDVTLQHYHNKGSGAQPASPAWYPAAHESSLEVDTPAQACNMQFTIPRYLRVDTLQTAKTVLHIVYNT